MHPLVQVNRASLCLQSSSTQKNKELAQEGFSIFYDLSPKKATTVEERMAPVRIYFSKQANEEILPAWELHYSVKPQYYWKISCLKNTETFSELQMALLVLIGYLFTTETLEWCFHNVDSLSIWQSQFIIIFLHRSKIYMWLIGVEGSN